MQRLYGLAAYLPMVLPHEHAEELPDEIALVFYRTQQAYTDSKLYPAGRAYSDLHELVFDLDVSRSGFPNLFAGEFELNQPWHLFSNTADWQTGLADVLIAHTYLGIGPRSGGRSSNWNKNFDLKKAPQVWQAAQGSGQRRETT
jgi:hypothetical protein